MRYRPLLLLYSALAAGGVSDLLAQPHREHRLEAEAAYARKDYTTAKAALGDALRLRPDSPRYLQMLAAVSALAGDPAGAIAALNQIADLGVAVATERDRDFSALESTPELRRVQQRFAENRAPQGETHGWAELPGRSGIIEGIAYRAKSGELYLGDVYNRCIWRRDRDGRVVRYSAEDEELFGVFGLAFDEPRNVLWATTTAVPEMTGYETAMKGMAGLAEFNLANSELKRVVFLPVDGREHGLGDLAVAADGTIYATDSMAPLIWQLSPGAEDFEILADSPLFGSLQGIVLEGRTLIVADHSNGLFTVDLASREVKALPTPKNVTLVGLDGLVAVPGGVVATQNATDPQRVLHIALKPDLQGIAKVAVLASGQPELRDLSLITLVDGVPAVISSAGWEGYEPAAGRAPTTRNVRILQVPLPPAP